MDESQNSAVRKALQDRTVLQQILQYRSISGKTSRLVCHLWNEITLSLPQPKLTLRLYPKASVSSENVDCCHAAPLQLLCVKMEPRIARSVKEYGCQLQDKHSPKERIHAAESKLLHVSGKCLEDLTIAFTEPGLISTLYDLLKTCCPNLNRLKIYCQSEKFKDDLALPPCNLEKLTSLKIFDASKHSGLLKMTQTILDSAPNLTQLSYHGKKYPDLSRNGAITWIKVDFDYMEAKDISSCRGPHGLNMMLDQVKDHLEFLHVETDMYHVEDAVEEKTRIGFQIPEMKNLKRFQNNMLDCFSCGDKLQNICSARIPTLESLCIGESEFSLDNVLRSIGKKKDLFSGVKVLHIADVQLSESIARLKTPFPNLESLTIHQFRRCYDVDLFDMAPHLEACAPLGLKCLKLELANHQEYMEEFMLGFADSGKLFSSFKTVEIELHDGVSDNLDSVKNGIEKLKKCLLGVKGLNNLSISGIKFKEETWKWVEPFIYENKIPIVFVR